jgi:hypothetical protein
MGPTFLSLERKSYLVPKYAQLWAKGASVDYEWKARLAARGFVLKCI